MDIDNDLLYSYLDCTDRGKLLTEEPNPRSEYLDILDTSDLVKLFLQSKINILELNIPTEVEFISSDMNSDGVINVLDIVLIVDIIFNN